MRMGWLIQSSKDFMERINRDRLHAISAAPITAPLVQSARPAKQYEVTPPTARADIDKLVKAGILSKLEDSQPYTYFNVTFVQLKAETEKTAKK